MAEDPQPDWITSELRRAAVSERAPAHLRLQVDELSRRPAQSPRSPRRRLAILSAAAVTLALVGVVLTLALPSGAPGGPTVAQAAYDAFAPNDIVFGRQAPSLYPSFADVRFPSGLRNWPRYGEIVKRIDGRRMVLILYERGNQLLVYAIAASPVLRDQKDGFTSFRIPYRTAVSWQESDHSCLLIGQGVSRSTLVALARS